MNKILLVLQREYLVRVRKPSFIYMTILTPLLFAGMILLPVLLATSFEQEKKIEVLDESGQIVKNLKDKDKLKYVASKNENLQDAKAKLEEGEFYAILHIPKIDLNAPKGISIIGKKSISLELELEIRGDIEKVIEDIKLTRSGIDKKVLESIKTKVDIQPATLKGEESSSGAAFALGFLGAFIIYMAILLYSQQVIRGVVEEKTSRIIEVIICSVKPFQLMMGKILGVAAIGMTQFLLWIILTFAIVTGVSAVFGLESVSQQAAVNQTTASSSEKPKQEDEQTLKKVYAEFANVPIVMILCTFLFYFLGGYLLYSALFAAIASAVDSETDTQQFALPVTMPLIIAFVAFQAVIRDPDGAVAFWMSIIPLTSPIIMMVRIPFGGVAAWELILSMVLLVLGFIGTTWVASRIYRVGILMYGKKVNFKELGKWIFYKM